MAQSTISQFEVLGIYEALSTTLPTYLIQKIKLLETYFKAANALWQLITSIGLSPTERLLPSASILPDPKKMKKTMKGII